MCTHYRSSRLDWLYLYHQQVPNSRNWGGGQFLSRSHRTIPTRHCGLRITRHQEGEMTVFCYGEFCQTPLVLGTGIEPIF